MMIEETINEVNRRLKLIEESLSMTRKERNELVLIRFKELYNITNYNKIKVGHVYEELAKEFGIKPITIRKILSGLKN